LLAIGINHQLVLYSIRAQHTSQITLNEGLSQFFAIAHNSPLHKTSHCGFCFSFVSNTLWYSASSPSEILKPPQTIKTTIGLVFDRLGTSFSKSAGEYAEVSVAAHASSTNIFWSSVVLR
jgi:hypothetical protein